MLCGLLRVTEIPESFGCWAEESQPSAVFFSTYKAQVADVWFNTPVLSTPACGDAQSELVLNVHWHPQSVGFFLCFQETEILKQLLRTYP